jgi:cell division protein FtsW
VRGKPLTIFLLMLTLSGLGLIIVGSATSWISLKQYNDSFYMLKKQAFSFLLGLISFFIMFSIPLKTLRKYAHWIVFVSLFLMALLLTPLAVNSGGSTRWLYLFGFQFQPSEVLKLAIIVFLSALFSKAAFNKKSWTAWFSSALFALVPVICIAAEPDIGSAITVLAVVLIIFFIGGMPIKQIMVGIPLIAGGMAAVILFVPYAKARILSFANPGLDPLGTGYNQIQSIIGVKAGGIFGRGLGLSLQKFQWLPQAYNDFIFSILAEETGFIGVLIFLGFYLALLITGFQLGLKSQQPFNSLLAVGISSLLAIQALLHIGVSCGILPVTGITLPFLSYGGTSLLISMMSCGILARIAKEEAVVL